jgi:hypothetical protein
VANTSGRYVKILSSHNEYWIVKGKENTSQAGHVSAIIHGCKEDADTYRNNIFGLYADEYEIMSLIPMYND